ncbi:MAG: tryptophan dimethylallyltransferase family protein [Polyangiaceae bacterium]
MNFRHRERPVTLLELGHERLAALGCALDLPATQLTTAHDLFERLSTGWAEQPLHAAPRFASDITDDHTPFEFSLALDGATSELRFLSEVQAERPSHGANWLAALRATEALGGRFGVDLERLDRVRELFAPTHDCPRFALWHAVCFRPTGAPDVKVYLNPQAGGAAQASDCVERAMTRLGLRSAWQALPKAGPQDELCYFSLDLAAHAAARVKLYVAHHGADSERIERAVAGARGYSPGRASGFCRALAPLNRYTKRPVITCLSFVEGDLAPTTATVHFPVRSYADSDDAVRTALRGYLPSTSTQPYTEALEAFARRSLGARSGMQTYASLRLDPGRDRVTVYLAPEAYANPVASSVRPSRPLPMQATQAGAT